MKNKDYIKNREEQIEKAKEILKDYDIELNISGCGCCGSPDVLMKHKGEYIISYSEKGGKHYSVDDCNIIMIEE